MVCEDMADVLFDLYGSVSQLSWSFIKNLWFKICKSDPIAMF